ncbi:MAG: CsbD family protein [Chthoniobacterales bacterium]
MNSGNEDKAEGTAKEAIGTVKQKTGELVGNEDLEARGAAERAEGKVQDKMGDVKKVFEE